MASEWHVIRRPAGARECRFLLPVIAGITVLIALAVGVSVGECRGKTEQLSSLLAISRSGEMALALNGQLTGHSVPINAPLAQVSLGGWNTPRDT